MGNCSKNGRIKGSLDEFHTHAIDFLHTGMCMLTLVILMRVSWVSQGTMGSGGPTRLEIAFKLTCIFRLCTFYIRIFRTTV